MSFFGNVANRFGWARPIWEAISRPSIYFPLGALVLSGFVAGVTFWGAFNTALEATNSERFCTGCHEMRSNVFEELKSTIHFSNRSGVRASCPDCHVPHNWTDKIARKCKPPRRSGATYSAPSTHARNFSITDLSLPAMNGRA